MTAQHDREENQRAPLSAYLNNSTIRGLGLILLGIFGLAVPKASHFLFGLAVAAGLILYGALDIRSSFATRPISWLSLTLGVVYVAAGVVLVVFTDKTLRLVSIAFGVAIVVRGLLAAVSAVRSRKARTTWTFEMTRGLLTAAVGGVVIIVPEAIIGGSIFAIAGIAIVGGAISLSVGITLAHDVDVDPNTEITSYLKKWFSERDVGDTMREDVVDSLFFENPGATQKQVGFWVLLVLSVAIATLGIIADSTAVVIGAMLVAPLMTPIMAVSVGIVNGWPRRVTMAFLTVAGGVAVSVGVAWILAAWVPQLTPNTTNSQIVSRVSPTLVDMLIAVAAGAAGAYATVDKRVSSSITGVAIAVALVPPLGVVGITLKAGEYGDASGAFLLFLTNLVAIILMASIVFVVAGLVPLEQFVENRKKTRTVISTVALAALLIMVPLFFTSEGILASAARQSTAQQITEDWIAADPDLTLEKVTVDNDDISVVLAGEGDVPSVEDLETSLEDAFDTQIFVDVQYFPSVRITSEDQ